MDAGEQAGGESSANRRERLLALRSAAAAASTTPSSSSPSAAPPPAAWDLPEPDLTPASSAPRPRARFDFYTNPGAAFSSTSTPHKRKSADPPPPSPAPPPPHGNYGNNHPPPHQHHMAPSPMELGAPGWRSPMQFQTPMSGYQGTPPGPPPHWNPHSGSPAQDYYSHSPNFGFRGSNAGRGGSPMNYVPRGSPMNYRPRGSPMSYVPRGSPASYIPRGSPYSSSGRGRGEDYYNNSGSRGRGGRGGLGFQNHSGSQDRRNYYWKSMVDDPWQDLQPIVGSILIPIDGAKPWLPESLRKKKGTADQGRIISNPTSGLSLAEGSPMNYVPRGSPMSYVPRGSPASYIPRGSPYSSSGRGRGEDYYNNSGSRGRGGRGGLGFQNHSGSQDQRNYYWKSMVDDPWQDLQPIVGSILIPIDGAKPWLPESLRKKKETADQGRIISNPTSGLSLAEYLDLSFNEASKET